MNLTGTAVNCSRSISVSEGTDVSLICMVGSFRHQRWCDGRVVERKQWNLQDTPEAKDEVQNGDRLDTSIPYGKFLFTARKRSLRRLCFHRCLCPRGGGGSLAGGMWQTPPWADAPTPTPQIPFAFEFECKWLNNLCTAQLPFGYSEIIMLFY